MDARMDAVSMIDGAKVKYYWMDASTSAIKGINIWHIKWVDIVTSKKRLRHADVTVQDRVQYVLAVCACPQCGKYPKGPTTPTWFACGLRWEMSDGCLSLYKGAFACGDCELKSDKTESWMADNGILLASEEEWQREGMYRPQDAELQRLGIIAWIRQERVSNTCGWKEAMEQIHLEQPGMYWAPPKTENGLDWNNSSLEAAYLEAVKLRATRIT